MKTSTMIVIGLAGVGAYLAYKASAPQSSAVTGATPAGALNPLRALPSLGHPLVQPHRLAMIGRI